jgi:hypothetical protein
MMDAMPRGTMRWNAVEWMFAALVFAIGVANLLFVHPVPAIGYGLVSLVYLPPANAWLAAKSGVSIHPVVKIALGIVIVMFTLGVSDLGDMID